MTSYITYDAQQARFDDVRRRAPRRRVRHERQNTRPRARRLALRLRSA